MDYATLNKHRQEMLSRAYKSGDAPRVDKQVAANMYRDGDSLEVIADKMNVSKQRIWQILKRYYPALALKRSVKQFEIKKVHNQDSELFIVNKLNQKGFDTLTQPYNSPYDLLVNGYKVEVKYSSKPTRLSKKGYDGLYFKFTSCYTLVPVDFYIFVCGELTDAKCYILSADRVNPFVAIPEFPKYKKTVEKWKNSFENWDIVKKS